MGSKVPEIIKAAVREGMKEMAQKRKAMMKEVSRAEMKEMKAFIEKKVFCFFLSEYLSHRISV